MYIFLLIYINIYMILHPGLVKCMVSIKDRQRLVKCGDLLSVTFNIHRRVNFQLWILGQNEDKIRKTMEKSKQDRHFQRGAASHVDFLFKGD